MPEVLRLDGLHHLEVLDHQHRLAKGVVAKELFTSELLTEVEDVFVAILFPAQEVERSKRKSPGFERNSSPLPSVNVKYLHSPWCPYFHSPVKVLGDHVVEQKK